MVDRILCFSGVSFYFGTTIHPPQPPHTAHSVMSRMDDLRCHMGSNCIYDTTNDISGSVIQVENYC